MAVCPSKFASSSFSAFANRNTSWLTLTSGTLTPSLSVKALVNGMPHFIETFDILYNHFPITAADFFFLLSILK